MNTSLPYRSQSRSRSGVSTLAVLFGLLSALAIAWLLIDWLYAYPADVERSFVGKNRCAECHAQEYEDWSGSHHDLAMDLATSATVLGDFNNQTIEHFGITTTLFRDGEKFMVNTEGPDGSLQDFEVKYVFGVDPLQQYMVEIEPPGSGQVDPVGRVQVLRVSWDTTKKEWFYLKPPDVNEKLNPEDPLHWTGSAQNWNHMCAECHSTNLQKNFDVAEMRYSTTFDEIDVSCEACHGAGSLHSNLASAWSPFWDRNHGKGLTSLKSGEAMTEIQACAPCHSRRSLVATGFQCGQNYYDHFANEVCRSSTYYPDGQMLDEVYVYGSFLQSKMYAKGIRCTDCHNPHSTRLKHDGNKVCTSCHQHPEGKYDTTAHHHHEAGSTGASCVNCHMMATPYMAVDYRHDHSFQIPRPDMSLNLKTPNACTGCHLDAEALPAEKRGDMKSYADWMQAARDGDEVVASELEKWDRWSAERTAEWYADSKIEKVDFATTLKRGFDGDVTAGPDLANLATNKNVSGMVRASALQHLRNYPVSTGITAASEGLKDRDPMVRGEAIPFFDGIPGANRVPLLSELLNDPVRHVRIQAAIALSDAPKSTLSKQQKERLVASLDEYRAAMNVNNDQAPAHMAIALIEERSGNVRAAEDAYRRAIIVQPLVTGPRSNLAALLERTGRDGEARLYRRDELDLMVRDSKLAPNDANLQYRLGLAFYLNGKYELAESTMLKSIDLAPENPNFVLPLTLLYQKQGNFSAAIRFADRLLEIDAGNAMYRQLRGELEKQQAAVEKN